MRLARLFALLLAVSVPAVSSLPQEAKADFNPRGRGRPGGARPTAPQTGGARGGVRPGPRTPTTATPTTPQPQGQPGPNDSEKGVGRDALIARYMGIVLARPSAAFPLRRLAELYRERDGDLKKLIDELNQKAQAGQPNASNAKVALAGIYRMDKRVDDAIRVYREVLAEHPGDPEPLRALAEVMQESGNFTEARSLYDQLLAKLTATPDKEDVLRLLLKLALDQKDYAGARAYHTKLVGFAQGSLFVRAELGRELLQRGEYTQAEAEYRELVKAAAGDNRALAPALRDLGRVLVRQGKHQEAIEVLRRALAIAGREAGVRSEIHSLITEAYRAEGKLPELIALLESQRGSDFEELVTLGLLQEETGHVDKALDVYRRALQSNPRHIDTRLKVIHILQAQGELDEAIKEYEALVRAVPNNPDFVFELCEILIQRGDRAKALKLISSVEGRAQDDDQLARIADFYERIEESDKAMRILQRLAGGGARDPQYIIDLGDRYFQQGDKKKALETWARLRTIISNRAEALAKLAEVYLDHDMPKEALEAIREAVSAEPKNLRYLKALAMTLERTAASQGSRYGMAAGNRYVEAQQVWQQVLDGAIAAGDANQAREARLHLVTLWSLSHQLAGQVPQLARRFASNPPDIESGRMLIEVLIRLQRLPEAETALGRLTTLQPGDVDAFLTLERIYVLQRKLDAAIKVLKRLTELDAKRARQYYQRMAQYAAELYRDDEAVGYAAQAVALAPDDADGHRKLGEMYRRRQDTDRAIDEFRAAIAKNDRLFVVYFDLAELLLARGKADEADQFYRRVVRSCPDEEMVARAARLSMQLNLGKGTLQVLEHELLPVALGNPQKAVYRRLLVDLYGAMTFPLVQKVRYGTEAQAKEARAELEKVGARAVKPLLDALVDENQSQQLIAIEVLAFVENRSAAPALFAFATGHADSALRVRAMVACGSLRAPELLPRYKSLLVPDSNTPALFGGAIPVAAAWGVARMQQPKAEPLLREIAKRSPPDIRALALLGLGVGQYKDAAPLLVDVATSPDSGNMAKAAAVLALAEIGARQHASVALSLSRSPDPLTREAALIALAKLDPARAKEPVAEAVFETNPSLRKAAIAAAMLATTGKAPMVRDPFEVPDEALDVRAILESRVPTGYNVSDRAQALIALEEPLTKAALNAVRISPERATLLADAMLARAKGLSFGAFTDGMDSLSPAEQAKVAPVLARIAQAVTPGFIALVHHPSTELRLRAIRVLARQNTPDAQKAVISALTDEDEGVQRTVLAVLGEMGTAPAVQALSEVLSTNANWALRVRAAEALGALPAGQLSPQAFQALASAAKQDAYALVRQAAAEALAHQGTPEARTVLAAVAKQDAEPQVRQVAQRLLGNR